MKKNLLKCTVILLASIFIFASCNNEEKSIATPEAKADVQTLMDDLDALNATTLAKYNNTANFVTRGAGMVFDSNTPEFEQAKMKWWKRLLCVIAADAMGAVVGSEVGTPAFGAALGVAASIIMYASTGCMSAIDNNSTDFDAYTIVMDSINYNMNNNISGFDKIGDCHNTIIREILNNKETYTNEDGSLKEDLVIEKIKSSVGTFGYDVNSISTSSIATELNKLSTSGVINKDATLDSQVSSYITLYPERSNEAAIIKSYVTTAASLPNVEAIKDYSAVFESKVYCAQIDAQHKAYILSGVSVAKNSTVGWNIGTRQNLATAPRY